MNDIKWGIIGCGGVCEVKSGPAFYKCSNSSLRAVMRRDAAKCEDYATRHNAALWYTDADRIITDPLIDIVYIATPPSTHAKYAVQALNAGKHVYIEKPMAVNYAECVEILQAAEHNRKKVFVAYYRRGLPYFNKVKDIVGSGAIGNVQTVMVKFIRPAAPYDLTPETQIWRVNKALSGGGYFYDLASHTIDILQYILGSINDARGFISNTARLYEVEDTVSASFLFDSGVLGSGLWSYAANGLKREDSIEISGNRGTIICSTFMFTPIELHIEGGVETFDLPAPQHIQQPLVQSIVDELRGMGKCTSTGETAALTNLIIDKIFCG